MAIKLKGNKKEEAFFSGETGVLYKANYVATNDGSGARCAWCNKKVDSIKDFNKHIDNHERTTNKP